MGANRGLGAAVRRGLAEAVDRGAAAVAFCDADGEYAPEELESLVAPILDGRADYVVGSRFAGRIERMQPRTGASATSCSRACCRSWPGTRITDGQSGYRALSRAAAADAEIVHDFNYAQVLTLDLLAKGYRYAEVPIRYRFREHGRSFVRLAAVPAPRRPGGLREVNGSVLDDVGREASPGARPGARRRRSRRGRGSRRRPRPWRGRGGRCRARTAPGGRASAGRAARRPSASSAARRALDAGPQHRVGVAQARGLDGRDLRAR